jgi:undecaprenyl-diphosphatase
MLRKEVSRSLSRWLGFVLTVELVLGLLLSVGVIWLFAQLVEEVIDGESRRFDETVLLWIYANFPAWLDEPMLLGTALGYYLVILPLLAAVTYAFYRKGARISATLLPVSTVGSMFLTEILKWVCQRARPELFDSGYYASGYSFPSGHATLAVGFYGTLTLLLA